MLENKAKLHLLALVKFKFNWTHQHSPLPVSTRAVAVAALSVILSILHQAKQKQYELDDLQFFLSSSNQRRQQPLLQLQKAKTLQLHKKKNTFFLTQTAKRVSILTLPLHK